MVIGISCTEFYHVRYELGIGPFEIKITRVVQYSVGSSEEEHIKQLIFGIIKRLLHLSVDIRAS